jgi:hypothetical protein
VVLVVDILNREYPKGTSIRGMSKRLKEIPSKLHDLFEMIISRDAEDLEQMRLCLTWVLFATRPLKPQELYFAVHLGLDQKRPTDWDEEGVGAEQMKNFVRNSSKGLAEVTRNRSSEVQFIHESVRHFLLGKYGTRWSGFTENIAGHSNRLLSDICLAQVNASINETIGIPDTLPRVAETKQIREAICSKFPFVEYAVQNVLRHADRAGQNGLDESDFLTIFPCQRWIVLNNTLEQYQIRRHTLQASLLYILAECNVAALI